MRPPPLEFAATAVGGMTTTVEGDGFVGYVFRLADGNGGCLVVQRAWSGAGRRARRTGVSSR